MQRVKRQGGRYMMFADMKAIFDNMERSILRRELRKKGETNQENGVDICENRNGSKDESRLHEKLQDEERCKARLYVESTPF